MRKSLYFLLVALLLPPFVSAHEVSIHQRMSYIAASKSIRFTDFVEDAGIYPRLTTDWREFVVADTTKFTVVEDETKFVVGIGSLNRVLLRKTPELWDAFGAKTDSGACDPKWAICVGSVFEDKFPRFCNHFYTPVSLEEGRAYDPLVPICGTNFDAKTWALTATSNEFSQELLLEEFRYAYSAAPNVEARGRSIYNTLKGLGHLIHLIQDMSQPSHTRDDGHGCIGGFESGALACASFETYFDQEPHRGAVWKYSRDNPRSARTVSPGSAISYLAGFSALHFRSDDTITSSVLSPEVEAELATVHGEPQIRFDVDRGFVFNTVNGVTVPIALIESPTKLSLDSEELLEGYAEWLYPKGVEYSTYAINHIFRGRIVIKESLIENGSLLVSVENASIVDESPAAVTFSSGRWYLSVDGGDNSYRYVEVDLGRSLAPGETARLPFRLDDIASFTENPNKVVFSLTFIGDIGDEEGVAVTRGAVSGGFFSARENVSDAAGLAETLDWVGFSEVRGRVGGDETCHPLFASMDASPGLARFSPGAVWNYDGFSNVGLFPFEAVRRCDHQTSQNTVSETIEVCRHWRQNANAGAERENARMRTLRSFETRSGITRSIDNWTRDYRFEHEIRLWSDPAEFLGEGECPNEHRTAAPSRLVPALLGALAFRLEPRTIIDIKISLRSNEIAESLFGIVGLGEAGALGGFSQYIRSGDRTIRLCSKRIQALGEDPREDPRRLMAPQMGRVLLAELKAGPMWEQGIQKWLALHPSGVAGDSGENDDSGSEADFPKSVHVLISVNFESGLCIRRDQQLAVNDVASLSWKKSVVGFDHQCDSACLVWEGPLVEHLELDCDDLESTWPPDGDSRAGHRTAFDGTPTDDRASPLPVPSGGEPYGGGGDPYGKKSPKLPYGK